MGQTANNISLIISNNDWQILCYSIYMEKKSTLKYSSIKTSPIDEEMSKKLYEYRNKTLT